MTGKPIREQTWESNNFTVIDTSRPEIRYGGRPVCHAGGVGNGIGESLELANSISSLPDLVRACEACLCWLTNCNTNDPATLGRQIMAALEKSGYDKQLLDDAAVALARGPCSVPNMMGEE